MALLAFFKRPLSPSKPAQRRPLPPIPVPQPPLVQPVPAPVPAPVMPLPQPTAIPRTPSLTSSSDSAPSDSHASPPEKADYPRFPTIDTSNVSSYNGEAVLVSSPASIIESPMLESNPNPDPELVSPTAQRPPRARQPIFMPEQPKPQDILTPVTGDIPRANLLLLKAYSCYFVAICYQPRILQYLLSFLDFQEFRNLTIASKTLLGLMHNDRSRDVILGRFVPGYRSGRAQYTNRPPIRVDFSDLEWLMMSQMLPVHQYPMHALNVIGGGALPSTTRQLERYALAHSRFILLLRSRANAVTALPELDDPFWRMSGVSEFGSLRELTFPAPLAYAASTLEMPPPESLLPTPPPESPSPTTKKTRRGSVLAMFGTIPRDSSLASESQTSLTYPGGLSKKTSTKKAPPPPPLEVPHAFQVYRTRTRSRANSRSRSRSGSVSTWTPGANRKLSQLVEEDDSDIFTPPRPQHLRSNSLPESRTHTASNSSQSLPRVQSPRVATPISLNNPHDLTMALAGSKAPICRVFVPTDRLSPAVVLACETQMRAAGLWEYLRPGDAVCNLGYVPLKDNEDELGTGGSGWLLFTGRALVPYVAPDPPPYINALAMPSPMYWSHLYQPFVSPRFFLKIPHSSRLRSPQLSLMPLASNVQSPASFRGLVKVKKYAWVGKIDGRDISQTDFMEGSPLMGPRANSLGILTGSAERLRPRPRDDLVGEGWNIEWVVETEGTPEGKKHLLAALNPPEDAPASEWEMIRDRCQPGKIWLRLVVLPPPTSSTDDIVA